MASETLSDDIPIADLFDQFIEATTLRNVLTIYQRILKSADLQPCEFNVFFPKLKKAIMGNGTKGNWKAKALLSKIYTKSNHRCYSNHKVVPNLSDLKSSDSKSREHEDDSFSPPQSSNRIYHSNNALQHHNCLVIGSGPAGLRTAIELQLLGASRVVIVEKRTRFSRNNVLHLWPFVIDDLKSLGAKKFYGKFCAGSIDHISIRQLQLILLKVCLMIGCDFKENCSYQCLCPTSIKRETPNDAEKEPIQTLKTKCDRDNSEHLNDSSDLNKNSESLPSVRIDDSTGRISERKDNSKSDTSINISSKINSSRGNLKGARAHFESGNKNLDELLHDIEWDVIIGADGRRNSWNRLFERKELRGKLAIAITANFVNHRTDIENSVSEIPGLSYMYYQDKFNALAFETGIQLENICYYKDDTHYFVMTAKKSSLLCRGVLKNDCANAQDLLSANNVDRDALLNYAMDAASWTTGLDPSFLEFATNHHGEEDCAMFDFTSMYAAQNACRALRTKGDGLCLIGLVGDSLLEPFWPTGSGCARGFLSSFDAAWMCRQWSVNRCAFLENHRSSSRQGRHRTSTGKQNLPATYDKMALNVLAERESIYRILNQTTSESLQAHYREWELNPHTRYRQLNRQFVTPNQVAYLLGEGDKPETGLSPRAKSKLSADSDRGRKVKSPSTINSRKSPKKLKSADASPIAQPKNCKNRSKSLTKYAFASRDQSGFELDETYLEFEDSCRQLTDTQRRSKGSSYIPYISGTSPSSHNLHDLETGRVREIDECMRQRRQTKKINVVCKELLEQFRNNAPSREQTANRAIRKDFTLFQELRRECELKLRGKENRPKSISNPLTLFNNVNRSASFAARLQTFEHRPRSFCEQDTTVSTPKTPIDNVKNLPQFATLQELFVNNSAQKKGDKKSHVHITKISKDDWNFKCWEERLASERMISAKTLAASTRSLNKAISIDSHQAKSVIKSTIKDEVFKDRVKDMAGKLKITKDEPKSHIGLSNLRREAAHERDTKVSSPGARYDGRPQGEWVKHLKSELTKGSSTKISSLTCKQPMNPSAPGKPIKKLFEEEEEDGKHYDHLCVNRTANNKQALKSSYSSHLVRTKYDRATSKVINTKPTAAAKQAYVAGLTSRGSSASSTLSDYSTNTGLSYSSSMRPNSNEDISCSRCCKPVSSMERITIGHANLHLNCLNCAQCGITLRMDELHHYLNLFEGLNEAMVDKCFVCSICEPDIKVKADGNSKVTPAHQDNSRAGSMKSQIMSREEFFSAPIDYNVVYKNLLDDDKANLNEVREIIGRLGSCSRETTPSVSTGTQSASNKSQTSQDYEDAVSKLDNVESLAARHDRSKVSPSPTTVTLPLKLVVGCQQLAKKPVAHDESSHCTIESSGSNGYKIARSETVDGSEQVTLILSDNSDSYNPVTTVNERASFTSKSRGVIDDDEIERRLNSRSSLSKLKDGKNKHKLASKASSNSTSSGSAAKSSGEDTSDENDGDERVQNDSDNSSSLPISDEEEDEESNGNVDSTYDDFATSEEFDSTSEQEEDGEPGEEDVPLDQVTGQPRVIDKAVPSSGNNYAGVNGKPASILSQQRQAILEPASVPS